MMLIFQFVPWIKFTERFSVERPARSGKIFENEKPPDFANEEWRKFDEPPKIGLGGLVSSFPLRRSRLERITSHDEHNQTGILTSASNLTPAFPFLRTVA